MDWTQLARLWLDETGDAPTPTGVAVASNERTFLELVSGEEPLLVQGVSLCRWARSVAQARNWSVQVLVSPLKQLMDVWPDLQPSVAQEIVRKLPLEGLTAAQPISAAKILALLDSASFWQQTRGSHHAVLWLMWWLAPDHDEALGFLARKAGQHWHAAERDPFLAKCYAVSSAEDAEVCLQEWLGILPAQNVPDWPIDTLPDSVRDRVLARTRKALSAGELDAETLRTSSLSTHLRVSIANALATYMRSRPELLGREWINWFRQLLPARTVHELERLRIPDDPGLSPQEGASVLDWYHHAYLPWKRWVNANRSGEN